MTTSLTLTLTIPAATLKALALFAAEKDPRYYIKGVCVDLHTPAAPVLVATDGHRMLAVHADQAAGCELQDPSTLPSPCPAECIIPIELIKALKPGTRGSVRVTLSDAMTPAPSKFDANPKPVFTRVTLAAIGGPEVSGNPVNGVYPDWRRVMPATTGATMVPFDVRSVNIGYLGDLVKALQLLGLVSGMVSTLPIYFGAYVSAGWVPSLEDLRTRGAAAHDCPLTMPLTSGVQAVVMGLRQMA